MSWWDADAFSSFATQALKNAQKKIDKVLDIQEEGQDAPSSAAETSWGWFGSSKSSKECITASTSEPAQLASKAVDAKDEGGDFWNAWLDPNKALSPTKPRAESTPKRPSSSDLSFEASLSRPSKDEKLLGRKTSRRGSPGKSLVSAKSVPKTEIEDPAFKEVSLEDIDSSIDVSSLSIPEANTSTSLDHPFLQVQSIVDDRLGADFASPSEESKIIEEHEERSLVKSIMESGTLKLKQKGPLKLGAKKQEAVKKTGAEPDVATASDSGISKNEPAVLSEPCDKEEAASNVTEVPVEEQTIEKPIAHDDALQASAFNPGMFNPSMTDTMHSEGGWSDAGLMGSIYNTLTDSMTASAIMKEVDSSNEDDHDQSESAEPSDSQDTVVMGESARTSEASLEPVTERVDLQASYVPDTPETVTEHVPETPIIVHTDNKNTGDEVVEVAAETEVITEVDGSTLEPVPDVLQISEESTATSSMDELSDSNRTLRSEEVLAAEADEAEGATQDIESEANTSNHAKESDENIADTAGSEKDMNISSASVTSGASSGLETIAGSAGSVAGSSEGCIVKNMLEEAMVESSKETDSHSSGSSLPSDMIRVGSGHNSGQTSGDEVDTTTSSDIEIISTPGSVNNGGESRNGAERPFDLSPLRQALKRSFPRSSPPGHTRTDSSSSGSGWSKNGEDIRSPEFGAKVSDIQLYRK